jgi:hypothetical protein
MLLSAVGCGGGTNTPSDEGYTPATIHQIATDPGNGPFGNSVQVVLQRVVAVTKIDKYVNATNQQCRYQIWIQDATCTTPPCGMVVKAIGPMAPSATASGKDCPSASTTSTPLAVVGRSDNLKIRGKVIVEVDSTPPMTVVEHQLFVDSLEVLDESQSVDPLVISDPAVINQFVQSQGQTWNKYEGMYVTLQPAGGGTLQVSDFNSDGFRTVPGNTHWGDTFDGDYYPTGVSTYPAIGTTFHAISGVVSTRHGGEIMPGRPRDFAP